MTALSTIHTIEMRAHGRYAVQVPDTPGPHPLLLGFHGYGENAATHLQALIRTLASSPSSGVRPADRGWLLVSVQAPARFYTKGDRGVVACWMTREDRELAIADNLEYVRSVVAAVRRDYDARHPLVYAGFSQGGAMAYRAAAMAERAAGLIVLAADIPPDVAPHARTLPPTLIGRGRTDEWYTEAKLAADVAVLERAKVPVETWVFDGGHVWHDTFARRAGEFLDEILVRYLRAPSRPS